MQERARRSKQEEKLEGYGGQAVWSSAVLRKRRRRLRILLAEVGFEPMKSAGRYGSVPKTI